MLKDFLEVIRETAKKILTSRVFALAVVFTVMFVTLIVKLFDLQIVRGQEFLDDYVQLTERTVKTPGTRGNIYDRNGNLLAYNEAAYSVTIQNTGVYKDSASMNAMLYRLVKILEKHGCNVQGKLEIGMDADGEFTYTTNSESARLRFLRDYYGVKSVNDLTDSSGKYPSAITAREAVERKVEAYKLNEMKDENGNPLVLNDWEKLQIVNIRYTMALVFYKRYEPSTITAYVDDKTVADIMEHEDELQGVGIEESTIRRYNDSIYFAPIIGYTGKVQEDQLDQLQKENPDYEASDVVGRTGIEASMESELQGKKGSRNLIVNNMGNIMQVVSETQPTTGNDVYLTIDRDLQIGIYHLIEKQLAGIVADRLVDHDVEITEKTDSSKIQIPVKDAYYQLINNNVLSLSHMAQDDASVTEKQIYNTFMVSRQQVLERIRYELMSDHPTAMKDLPKDMMAYMVYIYNYLSGSTVGIIQKNKIDQNSAAYLGWKDDTISLRDYIYAGISDNWIDTTRLDVKSKYSSADDIYSVLVDYVMNQLQDDTKFAKQIFRYLINGDVITGKQLCIALYDQGVLPYDAQQVQLLQANGSGYTYTFIREKIRNIQLTPAQLALDPCTGGVVITDIKTS